MELTLTTSITINASKSVVWDALVNPEIIKKYLYGTEAVSDWNVGSPLVFKGIWDGKTYEDKGVIIASEKESIFSYTYWSSFSGTEDLPENYATVIYTLTSENGKTILTINQNGFKTNEQVSHSESNWGAILGNLKSLLEA